MSVSERKFSQFFLFLCVGNLRNYNIIKNANVKVFTTVLSLLMKELDKNIRDNLAMGLKDVCRRYANLIGLIDCEIDVINEETTENFERICKYTELLSQRHPDNKWPIIYDALNQMGCKEVLEKCNNYFEEK